MGNSGHGIKYVKKMGTAEEKAELKSTLGDPSDINKRRFLFKAHKFGAQHKKEKTDECKKDAYRSIGWCMERYLTCCISCFLKRQ